MKNMKNEEKYLQVLEEEMIVAMGCTEPIALAFGAAKGRELLGKLPRKVYVEVSGNILKNVKGVVVPNTGGLRGVGAAVVVGLIAGISDKNLEVISVVSDEQKAEIAAFLAENEIEVVSMDTPNVLDFRITLDDRVVVRIADSHLNIVHIEMDGEVLFDKEITVKAADENYREFMSIQGIIDFANDVDLDKVRDLLEKQISYNTAISEEGLRNDWGANIGSVLLNTYGDETNNRCKACAAAGSDARMSGCELPVVIVAGSGNQGITASVPVIEFARINDIEHDKLLRALLISNLTTVHQKNKIGRLSAYCGAVSAGAGAGCSIAYLKGGGRDEIAHTLVNAVAITSGIICDGAKPSCAAKIAASVDAGLLGLAMYENHQQFRSGEGIVAKGVENVIDNVGELGRIGMRETDKEIIHLMIEGAC
ncbi:MAG: L-serine ammonia-lyase, iron-sulfur-dependent, subunit alpha [Lactobacillales bacterium]|jgi:L-cysteine desulfidase|nr:L-serine ammonia-lyase, iron-sulfur-dependent, subunit alpha [Lactobacillales bacterium]